ncbi:hypothetical protein GLAREA_09035 [Glarea lozoyensis ATCC 20868]|uniref:Uncharacterized protein n=1 Tax=Glarea lozoyensis (strain ATCC 20868 / MF5171) TaxID=1116229 RepID=S3DEP8_GLAL2|nr:uncharacterized protein GLAREA_09035 [Glarea lozoyensis ATCC 20868]EPE36872.1 hypothetical protein GLAREA_09035 [Glarea lozoyensis ATCC 20868]
MTFPTPGNASLISHLSTWRRKAPASELHRRLSISFFRRRPSRPKPTSTRAAFTYSSALPRTNRRWIRINDREIDPERATLISACPTVCLEDESPEEAKLKDATILRYELYRTVSASRRATDVEVHFAMALWASADFDIDLVAACGIIHTWEWICQSEGYACVDYLKLKERARFLIRKQDKGGCGTF